MDPDAEEIQEKAQPTKLFDLPETEGVNESERILTALCRRTFLRLWSQTNVYTDDGFKNGKGATKELCDALVVFGKEVILFSDKHVFFNDAKGLKVAWPRWYKKAVFESCRQLHGAKLWLERFPQRAFLDAKCTRPLPVPVPTENITFHLVAVTRGSRDAALAHNGGVGRGSFAVINAIKGDAHNELPFVIGIPQPEKHFVHVFDEVSIDLVLRELDTVVDFLDYLKKRQVLLGTSGTMVSATGEEELLAAYLRTTDAQGQEHLFFDVAHGEAPPGAIVFGAGSYDALTEDIGYKRKQLVDRVSYAWDQLIDRFIDYGDPKHLMPYLVQTNAETEHGLRLMAAESRYRRRQLAMSLLNAVERVEPGMRLGRVVYGGIAGETVFVFVIVPKRSTETYDEYRTYRRGVLHAYVRTAKLKAPLGTVFVGIALDNPHKDYDGGAEDLMVYSQESWSAAELVELERKRVELGLWKGKGEQWRLRQDEFPGDDQRAALRRVVEEPLVPSQKHNADKKRKAAKRQRKVQAASKRRNRNKK
ncbi:hypothetical protein [Variovorax sp. W2I14]|uniref:hypothetical protein n=1 Tax=Variovorax sp. W2I14 TaxID=3042290 RepID=UPI003D1DA8C0